MADAKKMSAKITDQGLRIDGLIMPAKEFKSGKTGFFKQQSIELDGEKYTLNLMAYKVEKREKK
jgi:hypothetical protein